MEYIDTEAGGVLRGLLDKLDEEEQDEGRQKHGRRSAGGSGGAAGGAVNMSDLEKAIRAERRAADIDNGQGCACAAVAYGHSRAGYNIQTATDDKHCRIADYEVTNEKDDYALAKMVKQGEAGIVSAEVEVLADKGYHTGEELKNCMKRGSPRT